jgi:hypothetical protein
MRRHVAIMERVKRRAELFRDLKKSRHARLRQFEPALAAIPGANRRRPAKHIGPLPAHRMPVNHREAQMIAHRLALDDFLRVVVLKRKRILGLRAFVRDAADVGQEIGRHIGDGVRASYLEANRA